MEETVEEHAESLVAFGPVERSFSDNVAAFMDGDPLSFDYNA